MIPQKDSYHDSVRKALEKDGWKVTHDPLTLRLEDVKFYLDLGAEKIIEPSKKVAVEIKVSADYHSSTNLKKRSGNI